jgi:hypothetical protein
VIWVKLFQEVFQNPGSIGFSLYILYIKRKGDEHDSPGYSNYGIYPYGDDNGCKSAPEKNASSGVAELP